MILPTKEVLTQVTTITIGTKIYTDYAPVTMQWNYKVNIPRQQFWKLRVYLLESKGTQEWLMKKTDFFETHRGSSDWVNIWEAFKAYMRGKFISFHSYQKKMSLQVRQGMIACIEELHKIHKQTGSEKVLFALEQETDHFKLLDAHKAAQDLLYTQQCWFEFRDKPGRALANLLTDKQES